MNIQEWVKKWGIPDEAVRDLHNVHRVGSEFINESDTPEGIVQNKVRLEASKKGLRLWRNNVGAVTTDDGRHIRFGLCNESSKINRYIKSSDLIGIRPVLITPQHVGSIIGQFVAREIKSGNWFYKATKREQAQLRYLEIINGYGGDGAFANCEGTL